ncbi:MAG: isopentenyl phosphate kinase [Thermoplasmata archaeon]
MPAPRPLAIVKLGGSVLTRKGESERLRPKVLHRLAAEVAALGDRPMVLLHGAGSFGHPGASRFGLARPPATSAEERARVRGASIVSAEVRRLHLAVLRALVEAGGRPWSVPPSGIARQSEGRLVSLDPEPFRVALAGGWTPVSFGDVVPDAVWGSSILSADTIATTLAVALRPRRVIFVTDVPGIYRPGAPAPGRREIVREISPEILASLSTGTEGRDVTGGIRGKAAAMCAIAGAGVDAGLISGLSDGALSRALEGAPVDGSWARAKPDASERREGPASA